MMRALTLLVESFDPYKPVPDMTYNAFGGTLSLTQSINFNRLTDGRKKRAETQTQKLKPSEGSRILWEGSQASKREGLPCFPFFFTLLLPSLFLSVNLSQSLAIPYRFPFHSGASSDIALKITDWLIDWFLIPPQFSSFRRSLLSPAFPPTPSETRRTSSEGVWEQYKYPSAALTAQTPTQPRFSYILTYFREARERGRGYGPFIYQPLRKPRLYQQAPYTYKNCSNDCHSNIANTIRLINRLSVK